MKHGRGASAALAGPRRAAAPLADRNHTVTLLTGYLVLLMAVPSALVIGPLGAAGAPAGVFATFLFCWYLLARLHPAGPLDTGRQPVRVAVIVFACATLASYVSASRTTLPLLEQNGADRGLILLSGWLGVALLTADGIDRADRLEALLRRIVIGVTAMAAVGVVEFATGQNFASYILVPGLSVHEAATDFMSIGGQFRVTSTAAQPLEFTAVLLMTLPIAIHQARFAPGALRLRRWLQAGLIALALPMTVSRSGIVGLLIVGAMLFPTWLKRDRARGYRLVLGAIVLGWLADPGVLGSFTGLISKIGTDSSISSRTSAYSSAVSYIAQHPWLGRGFQTFYPQTYFFIDNQYLTSLIETGFAGLLALITLFATGWVVARSTRRLVGDEQTRDLLQCLAASIAVAAFEFSTFDVLSFVIAPGLTFLLLGCAGAASRLARAHLAAAHLAAARLPAARLPAAPG
jgi:polysaccharide biosynthesis protein PslJ